MTDSKENESIDEILLEIQKQEWAENEEAEKQLAKDIKEIADFVKAHKSLFEPRSEEQRQQSKLYWQSKISKIQVLVSIMKELVRIFVAGINKYEKLLEESKAHLDATNNSK